MKLRIVLKCLVDCYFGTHFIDVKILVLSDSLTKQMICYGDKSHVVS